MRERELRLFWSPEAEADLLAIWRWEASHFSPEIADTHLREIDRATSNLAEFPEAGVAPDQLIASASDRSSSIRP